jgi:competence protein ComEA
MRYLICIALVIGASAQTLPDGPGKDTFEATCSVCHSTDAVLGMHKTKAEWKSKVTEMLQEATDVSEADRTAIVEYLARSFPGTVNVNKATAKDLETIAGLSSKDSSAIVQYREAKGDFKTLDDLKKVPGIDTVKLDAKRTLLEFQ